MKNLLLLFFCTVFIFKTNAQAPFQFNFQGVAKNSLSSPISNKTIGLRFTIHDLNEFGTIEYIEKREATTDVNGVFNVIIGGPGSISKSGIINNQKWHTGVKYLQIEVNELNSGENFSNMGAVRLLSVPYAIISNYSDSSAYAKGSGDYFFEVSMNASSNFLHGSLHRIKFDSKIYDDSSVYNLQTGEFTAKDTGIYQFYLSLYLETENDGGYGDVYKNGAKIRHITLDFEENDYHNMERWHCNNSYMLKLNKGDVITIAIESIFDNYDEGPPNTNYLPGFILT